jgi:hypothetical protein
VYIARAHRLGARKQGTNFHKRPIIANFRDYGDVELILSKAKRLKSFPGFSIDCDYPKEIQAARARLWPLFKTERSKSSNVKILYPAKIISDGYIIKDEFPNWNYYISYDRMADIKHIEQQETINRHSNYQSPPHLLNSISMDNMNHHVSNATISNTKEQSLQTTHDMSTRYAPATNINIELQSDPGICQQNYNNTGSNLGQRSTENTPLELNENHGGSTHENTLFRELEQGQSRFVSHSYFGEIPTLIRSSNTVLSDDHLQSINNCPESVNQQTDVNPLTTQNNQNNTNTSNTSSEQTYVKAVNNETTENSRTHISRAKNRSMRRLNSTSPYGRTRTRNRFSPLSKNRNHEDRSESAGREQEVKR